MQEINREANLETRGRGLEFHSPATIPIPDYAETIPGITLQHLHHYQTFQDLNAFSHHPTSPIPCLPPQQPLSDPQRHLTPPFDPALPIKSIQPWFLSQTLNLAKNLFYTRPPAAPTTKKTTKTVITAIREGCTEPSHVTWQEQRVHARHGQAHERHDGTRRAEGPRGGSWRATLGWRC